MILGKNLYNKTNRIFNTVKTLSSSLPYLWKISFGREQSSDFTYKPEAGAPALTVKENGELRCTSCMLCQKVCPSHCIDIEIEEGSEEAAPVSFDINILRCTFCSLCAEVCPVDAIRMDGPMPMAGHSEQNWVWDKEYLKTYAGELKSRVGEDRPLLPY